LLLVCFNGAFPVCFCFPYSKIFRIVSLQAFFLIQIYVANWFEIPQLASNIAGRNYVENQIKLTAVNALY
jgi:hypothetical protein